MSANANPLDGLFGITKILVAGVEVAFHNTVNLLSGFTAGEGVDADGKKTLTLTAAGGGSSGDFVGPASSVNGRIVLFNGVTGKLGKQSSLLETDLIVAGGTTAFIGDQSFGGHKATNLGAGTLSTDAVNKSQLDAVDTAAFKKNGSVAATGDLNLGAHKATNAADASSSTDLTTLQQVTTAINAAFASAVATIADWKQSVRFATTTALAASTLASNVRTANANSAFPTVDGVTAVVGDRFLDKDHATGLARGIYTLTNAGSGGTPWVITRATDCDVSAEVTAGLTIAVTEGTANGPGNVNGGNVFMLTTPDPITLNTTSLTFTRIGTLLPDGVSLLVSGGVIVRAALTGDVTATAGSNATTIAPGAVDNSKIASAANIDWSKFAGANAKGQSPVWTGSVWAFFGVATKATNLTDANVTVTVADGNRMLLGSATLTALRNLTLGITGSPTDKEVIAVERYDTTANTYAVKNNAGTTLYTFPASSKRRAVFQYFTAGNDWVLSGHEAITS